MIEFEDDFEIDDVGCPKCGSETRSRNCHALYCEDGYIDEYEEDAINFAPGEEFVRCNECYGTGIERWCPKCGWEWKGE